ncbi:MAG: hypothetical protein LBJ12_08255 [Oscillospiraceae bacterium]|jgi:hypothetical protein|nr:hypothetical protein [Oscillospiraceae bacterium]
MAKYKKLPVEIEAFRYDGALKASDGRYYVPDWAAKAPNNAAFHSASRWSAEQL